MRATRDLNLNSTIHFVVFVARVMSSMENTSNLPCLNLWHTMRSARKLAGDSLQSAARGVYFALQMTQRQGLAGSLRWHEVCNVDCYLKKAGFCSIAVIAIGMKRRHFCLQRSQSLEPPEAVRSHMDYNYTYDKQGCFQR